jgi:hypothetical protein
MRSEISEPKHWRSPSTRSVSQRASRAKPRPTRAIETIPVEAVDAAFASESVPSEAVRGTNGREDGAERMLLSTSTPEESTIANLDLISSLSAQLSLLETQHDQLVELLAQAQSTRR